MIPKFPEFKKLELRDKADVEKFTLKYPPYADHNFVGTWSWDVRDQMKISELNGNYIIRFIDYISGEPFYTFLGENDVNDTAKKLLDLSAEEGCKVELKLIPEESAKLIDRNVFDVIEDLDNFDYVYDLLELSDYAGSKFSKKRNKFNTFIKKYPEAEARVISLGDAEIRDNIKTLYDKWVRTKIDAGIEFEHHQEHIVLDKFFAADNNFNMLYIGIFFKNQLIAFTVEEIMDSPYVVTHVVKSDLDFVGAHEFLMKKTAEILLARGKKFLNQEQDLGIESLRQAKSRFRPSFFLKKYKLTYCQ